MFLKNIIPIAPILTRTESPSVDTLDKNTPPQAGLLGMLAYLFFIIRDLLSMDLLGLKA